MTDPVYDLCARAPTHLTKVLMFTFHESVDFATFHPPKELHLMKNLLLTHNPEKRLRWMYNPFEMIPLKTSLTTMELASIVYAINPISCRSPDLYDPDNLRYVYFDLDSSPGMSIAMQIFYPKSYCYGLSQATGKDWNFVNNQLDIHNFMIQSTNIESLRHQCFLNNPRGIDLSLVVTKEYSIANDWYYLFVGISVLYETGTLIYRFNHRYDDDTAQMLFLASQCFDSIELYKPACSPCNDTSVYLIGRSRKTDQIAQAILTMIQNRFYGRLTSEFLKWHDYASHELLNQQIIALESINQSVDRRDLFNLEKAVALWKIPIAAPIGL
ncbi:Hypothetical protein POVR1_LOCUS90 [uncultured virus]|nr:Hypothetical protein POVR1_LOCUS90 [uncultured virus]